MTLFVIEGVNPEPWTASQSSTGLKGSKMVTRFFKDEKLRSYQEAVKESLRIDYPDYVKHPEVDLIALSFYFWRRLDHGAQVMDNTNGQKALEDALQGVLFVNDRQVKRNVTETFHQASNVSPLIVIEMNPWVGVTELVVRQWGWIEMERNSEKRPAAITKVRNVEGVF